MFALIVGLRQLFASILPFGCLLWARVVGQQATKSKDFFFFLTPVLMPLCSFSCFLFPFRIFAIEFHNTLEKGLQEDVT